MRTFLFIIMLAFSLQATAQIRSVSLTASGLTCSMCSKAIYKALLKLPSVKDVAVNIKDSKYTILFKEDAKIAPDDIKKAVEDAGFTVASMQVTAGFNNVEIANDAHISISGNTFHFLGVQKQTLNGDKSFTIVDKNFLPVKDHKKYGKYTAMKCFETGVMASCCPKNGVVNNRIYHVTI